MTRFDQALTLATQAHAGRIRKGTENALGLAVQGARVFRRSDGHSRHEYRTAEELPVGHALRWALNAGKGIIASDVGLGKTVASLMLVKTLVAVLITP